MTTRLLGAAVLFVSLGFASACKSTTTAQLDSAEKGDAPRGWLCIVGGGGTTDDMYERMFAAAGGKDARVVVLPQASELADTGEGSVAAWKQHGATNVAWLDLKQPTRDAAALRDARVIWFPGGVQTRLMKALGDAGLVELVRQRFRDGAVVGGTSAGAAVMSDVMITGDYDMSFEAERRANAADVAAAPVDERSLAATAEPATAADATPRATVPKATRAQDEDSGLRYIRPGTNVFAHGLGLLPHAIVDQHFVRRQRFNRLLSAVLDHPDLIGIGIDERTAIFVHGASFEVLGASNVVVLDARGACATTPADRARPGAVEGVRLAVLRPGMKHELASAGAR